VHLTTWLACNAPSLPQESLVHDETSISLPAKPSLTQTTPGQLCVAPRTSRSQPAATEPGCEPRVSGGTASTAMQCPRLLWLPGGQCYLFLSISSPDDEPKRWISNTTYFYPSSLHLFISDLHFLSRFLMLSLRLALSERGLYSGLGPLQSDHRLSRRLR
jgi:hypothetical protein